MKMIFVDAENIGLKELEKVKATVLDKVFVFSKLESVQRVCEKSLFLYLSDYPSGANQADFYIIAYLSRVLLALDKNQFGTVNFELYSNDENLISAFEFQCGQLGANVKSIRTKDDTVVQLPNVQKKSTPQDKVFSALKLPRPLDPSLQKQLGLSKSDFSKAINELTKSKKIKRSPESKRKWVCC
ncbi:TPA: hypothetical protein NKP78_004625 [Vibrio parahaemolyticus]|uniref:hypothetical protein n=1 Tax=Vibrio parahaemolyticus TaxID=670 RepID=UPI0008FCC6B0|nr:hypothetical protein [Vibrio parahaemolyticus]APC87642.1 hypothetical protein FORC22_1781 [Vibrio parahaemolyticus]EGU0168789.1 hypothetical protein [Vibrio parahaemolyticus]EHK9127980.1 hypothetical protein [Vibrio parahaemolyticus]EHR5479675.1 hypothetical protein [Vibrio parahaemolyticus]EHU4890198.1 hypothetical protein [Vibrio parahaemolyticus]